MGCVDFHQTLEFAESSPDANRQFRQVRRSTRFHSKGMIGLTRNVRYWPKADMTDRTAHVRFRG